MSDSKNIMKNTAFLYVRMLFSMLVSLYTSRVVLNALGVEDYGIYNVVGGVVTLFSFFNSAMSSATQRFLSYEIGKENFAKLKLTFNSTVNIHLGIAVIIFVLAQSIGLWFVNHKLNINPTKMYSVNWVYQFSILTFLVGVIQIPYNALIIARERMNIYAVYSIIEVVFRLLIVYLLVVSPYSKLESYSSLVFFVTLIIALLYRSYCKRKFKESKYTFYYDKILYRKLISYSGWNLFGNIAAVAKGQGVNILLNVFFGTIVNAAYGITMQVQGAVGQFINNFQLAVNPQIIKKFAEEDIKRSHKLIIFTSKYSFFLVLIIVTPILVSTDYILTLWLKVTPAQTATFVKLCLINLLIDCISGPLMTGAQATGNIKWYQIIVGSLLFLNLPICYFILKIGKNPEFVFIVSIVLSIIALQLRLFILKNIFDFSMGVFYKKVLLRIVLVSGSIILAIFAIGSNLQTPSIHTNFVVKSSIVLLIVLINILFLGVNKSERCFLTNAIFDKIKKR